MTIDEFNQVLAEIRDAAERNRIASLRTGRAHQAENARRLDVAHAILAAVPLSTVSAIAERLKL